MSAFWFKFFLFLRSLSSFCVKSFSFLSALTTAIQRFLGLPQHLVRWCWDIYSRYSLVVRGLYDHTSGDDFSAAYSRRHGHQGCLGCVRYECDLLATSLFQWRVAAGYVYLGQATFHCHTIWLIGWCTYTLDFLTSPVFYDRIADLIRNWTSWIEPGSCNNITINFNVFTIRYRAAILSRY